MANRKTLTDDEGEVRELTEKNFAHAVPLSALPAAEQQALRSLSRRGKQKTPRKVPISIRLSPDVVEGLRAAGDGWQVRADEVLRSGLATSAR